MQVQNTITLSNDTRLTKKASSELVEITSKIEEIENQLKQYNELQKSYDDFRTKLYEAMTKHNVTKYISNGGIQFTVVAASLDKTEVILKFNEEKFKKDNPDVYKKYTQQVEKTTKGKSSYLRITIPKGDE